MVQDIIKRMDTRVMCYFTLHQLDLIAVALDIAIDSKPPEEFLHAFINSKDFVDNCRKDI